jgi:hypothetical protein
MCVPPCTTAEGRTYVEAQGEQAGGTPSVSFHTTTPPPVILGPPETVSVREQAAVLKASVDAEHALTRYHFEYAACSSETETFAECAHPQSTQDLESSQYGVVGATQEISGLEPQASYAFRLVADNRFERQGTPEGGETVGEEGHFTTASLATPQATTGGAGAITATTALISGSVDPDGPPATYAFELGVYAGSATQLGIVSTGPVQAGVGFVERQLGLAGLQPGTTYAFRIVIRSGYGEAVGETMLFTTAGVASLLISPATLPLLQVPPTRFPTPPKQAHSTTRARKLALALKACAKKPKKQRASCEKTARKRYATKHKAKKRKVKKRKA